MGNLDQMLKEQGWAATIDYIMRSLEGDRLLIQEPEVVAFCRKHAPAIAGWYNGRTIEWPEGGP